MIKVRLPVKFNDGKQLYDAALKLIGRVSPVMAQIIHSKPDFNPFSVQLPDIICIMEPSLEIAVSQLPNTEIVSQMDFRECFTENPASLIELSFLNTFFKKAQTSYPLPDPWLMIGAWKNRWNSLLPARVGIEIPIENKRKSEKIQVRRANINTLRVQIADYQPNIAFCGSVRLKWLGDEKELREFVALARFAEFSGTGAKTTMGCGVTRLG